jgi:hypothetical protein
VASAYNDRRGLDTAGSLAGYFTAPPPEAGQVEMKILVLSDQLTIERLKLALETDGITLDGLNGNLPGNLPDKLPHDLEAAITCEYDLFIIDSLYPDISKCCDALINFNRTPLFLLLNEKNNDWREIAELSVDGFLSLRSGSAEIRARVNAATRRTQPASLWI